MKRRTLCTVTVALVVLSSAAEDAAVGFPRITDGLLYDMDASRSDLVITNENGFLVRWDSAYAHPEHGRISFTNYVAAGWSDAWYKTNGIGAGRPAIMTGMEPDLSRTNRCTVVATAAVPCRTAFLVFRSYDPQRQQCIWGKFKDGGYAIRGNNVNVGYVGNTQFLSGGRMWLNTFLWYFPERDWTGHTDHVNNPFVSSAPNLLVGEASETAAAAKGSFFTAIGDVQLSKLSGEWDKYFAGGYGEVVAYDRALTAVERIYVENELTRKWRDPRTPCVWKAGVTGAWNNPANWTAGVVPVSTDDVVIASGAVSVSGGAAARHVHFGDVNLTLSADSTLEISGLLSSDGAVSVTAAAGSRLMYGDYLKMSGATFAFASSGATLEVSPAAPGSCRARCSAAGVPSCERCCPVLLRKYWAISVLPGAVSGSGRLVKSGSSVLQLIPGAGFNANWELDVRGGELDLAGASYTFKSVTGAGVIVNSGERAALVVASDAAATFEPGLSGAVDVTFTGSGAKRIAGPLSPDGALTAMGGAISVSTNFTPAALGGVVVHVDASARETLTLDADNFVTRARSASAKCGTFTVPNNSALEGGPFYDATCLNGKPGLRFCWARGGTTYSAKLNALVGDSIVTNRTFFCVLKDNQTQYVKSDAISVLYGSYDYKNENRGSDMLSYSTQNSPGTFTSLMNGRTYIDGEIRYDADQGLTQVVTGKWNSVMLISWRRSANHYGKPVIGDSPYSNFKRTHTCAIGEVVVFDRPLADEEMDLMNTYLMSKWGVKPHSSAVTRTATPLQATGGVVLSGATLDLGGFTNAVGRIVDSGGGGAVTNGTMRTAELEVAVGVDGRFATIGGDADWDVGGMLLSFTGGDPAPGKAVKTAGLVSGTLGGVQPAKCAGGVSVNAHSIAYGGGLMFLIR